MDSTDLDKIVDKLLVFRSRLPRVEDNPQLTWFQRECIQEMLSRIDDFITAIDHFSLCGAV